MQAIVYEQFEHPLKLQQLPDPVPSPSGVVVKVGASGLCLSDWHGWMGHDPDIVLPHVPGHELAGTIVALGRKVKNWQLGERVTIPFVAGCGACEPCNNGNQQLCDHQFQPGFTAWGSFAEYVALEYADDNLVALPETLDFVAAASLGCRFVTAFRAVHDQGRLKPGQFLAVHGCGGVGLSAIMIAKALGAQVIGIDITDEKCALAKAIGADYTINASKSPVVAAIKDLSGGGVQLSVDALGHKTTFQNSIKALRKRGKHVQVGLMAGEHQKPEIPIDMIIAKELELVGSHGVQAYRYEAIFNLISQAKMDLGQLLGAIITLDMVPRHLPQLGSANTTGMTVLKMA